MHIHSPRNAKRSSMPAESGEVPFCKRERYPCAWDPAVSQIQAIRGLVAIFLEVDLISEARKVVALDEGNDHLLHDGMATILLVIDPVP